MFMRETFTLKLGFSLSSSPIVLLQPADVLVGRLRNERAGADCPIAPVRSLALAMSLKQDDCMAGIELGEGEGLNVREDCIENEFEVVNCRTTTIQIMKSTDAVEVSDRRSNGSEKLFCFVRT